MKEKNCENSLWNKIKWMLYSARIKVFKSKNKKERGLTEKTKKNLFLISLFAFPIVQFLIFYFGVNFNSILLAFQEYDGLGYKLVGVKNFKRVFEDIFVIGTLSVAIKNSAIQLVVSLFLTTPINILTAYVVFKKCPFSNFMKIMLFMPNMISSMVFVVNARVFIQDGLPILLNQPYLNLLNQNESSSFYTVLVFGCWMQFAGGLIVYLSAMSSISKDIIEYGKLEPLSSIKELWYVILPSIFPTITTYIVVGIAGFFTNAGFFYAFFSGNSSQTTPFDTLGYYFFVKVVGGRGEQNLLENYPYAAASGVLFTLFVAPVTLFVKHMLEKYGPSED